MKNILLVTLCLVFNISSCNQVTGINDITFGNGTDSATQPALTDTSTDTDTDTDTITETGTDTTTIPQGTDSDTSTSTDSCETNPEITWTCNGNQSTTSYDACGNSLETIECAATNGLCESGACGCAPGWTGDDCSKCVIYANANAPTSSNQDGSTWENAILSLSVGISTATTASCDLWVAAGTYIPGSTVNDSFVLQEGLNMYGGFAGSELIFSQRDVVANATILSGDLTGNDGENFANTTENACHVVTGANNTVLDGFTISGGNAATTGPCETAFGGGMIINNVSPVISNCIFSDNQTDNSGGAVAISGADSAPIFTDCTFRGNVSITEKTPGGGGAIYAYYANLTVINSGFYNNTASSTGGAIFNHGTPAIISDCDFEENLADSAGAISNLNEADSIITNCSFVNNTGTHSGGAIDNYTSHVITSNSIFIGNSAENGGAIYNWFFEPVVSNCTFVDNHASKFGGAIYNRTALKIVNSIFWNNDGPMQFGPEIFNDESTTSAIPSISYTNIKGGCASIPNAVCGEGNLDAEPFFVNEEGGDLRLNNVSPCIDAASNAQISKDVSDMDGNGITGEYLPYDLDGALRVVDGDNDATAIVDMGAFEYHP